MAAVRDAMDAARQLEVRRALGFDASPRRVSLPDVVAERRLLCGAARAEGS